MTIRSDSTKKTKRLLILAKKMKARTVVGRGEKGLLNPFRAPEPLPILNASNFVPQNGFPVVKGLVNPDLGFV